MTGISVSSALAKQQDGHVTCRIPEKDIHKRILVPFSASRCITMVLPVYLQQQQRLSSVERAPRQITPPRRDGGVAFFPYTNR